MDLDRRRELAERLHPLLQQQLGMGLDTQRMLNEPLYARDVLLVCAAHPGTELAALAWAYREASTPPRPARAPAPPLNPARASPGLGTHRHDPPAATQATMVARTAPVVTKVKQLPEVADSQLQPPLARSPLSRFSRLSLSRFGASIFGGSLFEGTLFGKQQADPVTDFGDDSYLSPPPGRKGRKDAKAGANPAAPRRARWFGR